MPKPKKIPEQELALRLGEALVPVLRAIDLEIQTGAAATEWIDELKTVLAKLYCKSRVDWPAWNGLTSSQEKACRRQAEKQLTAVTGFFQKKLDAELGE